MNHLSGAASWATDFWAEQAARYGPAWDTAQWLWANEQTRYAVILIGVAALAFLVLPDGARGRQQAGRQRQAEQSQDVARATNTPLLRRLWWRLFPPVDLMVIDGLMIDRTRKPHMGWFGPTGAGKSSAVAAVRVDGKRPTLIATPDISDPLREATLRLGGFIWTACTSGQPVDFLIGEPTEVAERLTKVFRSGGNGVWLRAARRATAEVIRTIDADDEPRTMKLIGERLAVAVKADKELKTACAMWVERFLDIADQLGDSVGPGGVDIAELLRQGKTVLIDNDAFDHLALGGDIVAFGLAEGQRCASLVPGGYRLIFEEAGQLGERVDLAEPFHRAGRRRRIACDDLSQSEADMNEGINSNIATRAYFAQELKSLQKVAADRLGIVYTALDPAAMRDFTAWIAHGKIRRLVRFPKPARAPQTRVSAADTIREDLRTPRSGHARRTVIVELPREREVLPALPPPSTEYSDLMRYIYKDGECERWSGKHDRAGHVQGCAGGCSKRHIHKVGCSTDCHDAEHERNCYGLVWWPLAEPTPTRTHEWQRVHRVRWRLAYGPIPVDPKTGKSQTIDHRRTCAKDCSSLGHINGPVSIGENVLRMHRGRGHNTSGQAAGAGR